MNSPSFDDRSGGRHAGEAPFGAKGNVRRLHWRGTMAKLAVLIALVGVAVPGCGPVSLTEEQHFERAVEMQEAGDLRAAAIELRNVLQQNPQHADARLRHGLVSMELGQRATARNELERALDLGADPIAATLPLARLWLMAGEYEQVLDTLAALDIEPSETDTRAQITLLQGEALAAQGELEAGLESYEMALELAPDLALAHVGVAAAHIAQGRLDEARSRLLVAVEMDDSLHQAWNLLGDLDRREFRLEEAETAYTRAIGLSPTPYTFHLKRALTRMAGQDLPGVEEDLRALRHLGPRRGSTAYVQGLMHFQQGQYAEAQSAFEQSVARTADFQPAIFFLGASHFAQQHWRRAEQNLERYLRAHPESDEAARLLALVRLREGDLDRVEGLLRSVLGRSPDDVLALNLMGNLYLARGQYEDGIGHLRHMVSVRPDDAAARSRLAGGLLRAGEREEGLRQLELAIEQEPGSEPLEASYIVNLIQDGQLDAALEAATRMAERAPESPLPHNLRAAALMAKGDLPKARDALRNALEVMPGDPAASANLAQLEALQGSTGEARQIYRESLWQNPGHLDITLRWARLEAESGDIDTMQRLLEQAIGQHPEALEPRLVLGRHHMSRGEPRRVLALLEPVRQSAAENRQMLDLLAQAQIGADLYAQAVNTLRALSEGAPDTAEARFRLGLGFEEAGSAREARGQFRRALDLDPTHGPSLRRLAELELREGRPDEALALARRLQQQEAVAAAGHAIEGRVHSGAGRQEQAAEAFEQAYALGPSAENAVALALAHQQLGRAKAAAELLGARLAEYPDETAVRFHLAQALMATGDNPGAIREYEDLVRTLPENVVVLNNLAFLYQTEGDERALEYAERAHARAPDNPAIADTLGWVLVNRGEVERALPLLERARQAMPDRPEVRYHYATALAEAGRRAEARQELAALLNEVEAFPQRADAETLLQSLR